jgi:hypothetical protein
MNGDIQAIFARMAADPQSTILAAFFFGVHISEEANGIGVGKTSSGKMVDLLAGIAKGEETLAPSGADIRQKAPQAKDIESIRTDNQQVMQVLARIILERLKQTPRTDA